MNAHPPLVPPETPLRWPAEWEPQSCVWMTWPQNEETWRPVRGRVESAYERAAEAILAFQPLRILVNDEIMRREAERRLAALPEDSRSRLEILVCPTNDSWIRDYGGFTVFAGKESPRRVMLDWTFNSWGGKYPPWDADDAAPRFMARHEGLPLLPVDFVLEGGSVDTNGRGKLLTTEQCLLNRNRNPSHSQARIETVLNRWLGIEEVLWLERGIEGDDTDGHIDDLARFVNERLIFAAVEHDRSDENYGNLRNNLRRLERLAGRMDIEVVELPMPSRLVIEGLRTPASYTNFLFVNGGVLVPVFENERDEQALRLFEKHLPGRRVVPLDCRHLVYGQGAIHCSSMQTAAAP